MRCRRKKVQVRYLISWWVLVMKIVWTVVRWRRRPRCRHKTGESVQSFTITDQSRSRHQCATASPQLCTQSAPDFIQIGSLSAECSWASDGQKWPWPLVAGDITRLELLYPFPLILRGTLTKSAYQRFCWDQCYCIMFWEWDVWESAFQVEIKKEICTIKLSSAVTLGGAHEWVETWRAQSVSGC